MGGVQAHHLGGTCYAPAFTPTHTYPPPTRELQKGKPESIPSTPACGLGAAVEATEVHVHTHSGHAFLEDSHATSLSYPHREEAGKTHTAALLPGLCRISSLSIPRLIWLFLCHPSLAGFRGGLVAAVTITRSRLSPGLCSLSRVCCQSRCILARQR